MVFSRLLLENARRVPMRQEYPVTRLIHCDGAGQGSQSKAVSALLATGRRFWFAGLNRLLGTSEDPHIGWNAVRSNLKDQGDFSTSLSPNRQDAQPEYRGRHIRSGVDSRRVTRQPRRRKFASTLADTRTTWPSLVPGVNRHWLTASTAFSSSPNPAT